MVPAGSRLLALLLKLCSIWSYTVKADQARDVSDCVSSAFCRNNYQIDPWTYQETEQTSALSCSFSRSLGVYDSTVEPTYRRLPKCGGNGKEWSTPSHTTYQFVASQWSGPIGPMDTVASNCTAVNRDSPGQEYHAWLRTGLFNGSSDGCSCFLLTAGYVFSRNSQPGDRLAAYIATVNDQGQEEDKVLLWKYSMYVVSNVSSSFFTRRNSFYVYFEAQHQKCDGSSIHLTAVATRVDRCNPTVFPSCYPPITTPRAKSSTTIQTTRTRLTTKRPDYTTSTSTSTRSHTSTSSAHPLWNSSPSCFSAANCMLIFDENPSLYIELEDPLALSCTFNRSLGVYEADDERQYRRLPKCGSDGEAWSTPSNSLYQFVASSWTSGSNQPDTVVSNCTAVDSSLTGQPYDAWLRTGLYNKTSMHCQCYRLTFDVLFTGDFRTRDAVRIRKVNLNENGPHEQAEWIGSVWPSQQESGTYFSRKEVYFAGRKAFYLDFQSEHERCGEGHSIHLTNIHTTVADCEPLSFPFCGHRSSTSTAIPETKSTPTRSSSTRMTIRTSTTLPQTSNTPETLWPITDPTNLTPGPTNSTSTTFLPEPSPHTSTSTMDSSTPHLNEQGLSRPLVDLLQAYNQTVEWLEQAPQVILQSMEKLNCSLNTEPSINFENVVIVAQLIEHISQFNTTESDAATDNGVTTVSQVLAIVDMLIEWDHYGHLNNIDASSMPSTEVAIKIYAALDNLANLIVPSEERVEPYLFNRTSVAVKISKKVLTANDTVENLRISNTVDVRHIKDHQVFPDFYHADRQDGVGISPGILLLRVSANELEKEFHHIQEMADPTARIFSLQLTSVKAFHFADIAYSPSMAQRKARKAAPIILMTGFHRPLQGIKGLITMMGDPFVLFKEQECIRKFGSKEFYCVYLQHSTWSGATSGYWSSKGCHLIRNRSSSVQTWICDHATPFTMVFDMCSSLTKSENLGGFSERALEPRIVTTIGLSASVVGLSIVLTHMSWRLAKGLMAWSTRNFTRMNIYSSLLVSNIAFLITEYMPDTGSENACFAFAVLSHWLILAASGWMMVEYYRIYRITRDVFSAVHEIKNSPSIAASRWTRRWTGFSVWFIPLAVAAFCALVEIDSSVFGGPVYLHKKMWCWMDPHHTVMIALFFVVPLTLAALLNIVVLLYFFTEQRSLSKKVLQDAKRANMNSLLNVTATCGFLAVTWLVGYFVLFSCTDDVTKEIFAYLFVLLNATQGVTVLIIHVYTLPNGFQTIVHEIFPRSMSKEALEAENSDKDLARGVETPPPRKRLGLPRGWSTDTLDTTGSIASSRKDRISPQLTHEKIFKV